jgi:hypothetical protein
MKKQECFLRFEGTARPDPTDIAEFLFLFRATYAAAVHNSKSNVATTLESAQELAGRSREYLALLGVKQLDRLFYRDLKEYPLTTRRISQESPLEIVLEGAMIAMVAAVIISGGKFKAINIFEAELAPLGDGIKKLRDALAKPTKSRISFGVRSRRVSLSKNERKELFQVDRSQREHGGFQRFLVGLQDRINQQGVLELSETDIDFILRHGRQASKGGFQGRIRKIFEKHFKFDDEA